METSTPINGTFICSINDFRYLDDVRVWLNLACLSCPPDHRLDSILITVNDHDQHCFDEVLTLSVTYENGILTAWEVLA